MILGLAFSIYYSRHKQQNLPYIPDNSRARLSSGVSNLLYDNIILNPHLKVKILDRPIPPPPLANLIKVTTRVRDLRPRMDPPRAIVPLPHDHTDVRRARERLAKRVDAAGDVPLAEEAGELGLVVDAAIMLRVQRLADDVLSTVVSEARSGT